MRHPQAIPKKYILPYGFVQSPIIASLCLYKSAIGRYLHHIKENEFKVSVYMDDILVSTNRPKAEAEYVFHKMKELAIRSGFQFNLDKTFSPSTKAEVFNIEIESDNLGLTEKRLEKFISQITESTNDLQVRGILNYIKQVNGEQYERLFILINSEVAMKLNNDG